MTVIAILTYLKRTWTWLIYLLAKIIAWECCFQLSTSKYAKLVSLYNLCCDISKLTLLSLVFPVNMTTAEGFCSQIIIRKSSRVAEVGSGAPMYDFLFKWPYIKSWKLSECDSYQCGSVSSISFHRTGSILDLQTQRANWQHHHCKEEIHSATLTVIGFC